MVKPENTSELMRHNERNPKFIALNANIKAKQTKTEWIQ